jgi:hypothetical protein
MAATRLRLDMVTDRVRVIVGDGVTETQLVKLAGRHTWWIHSRHASRGEEPTEYIYRTNDGGSFLHWIVDPKLGVTYILVKGPATPQIVEILRESLPFYSSGYIMKRAREADLSPADRREALYHLALNKMEHGFDQDTFDIYSKAMCDPDPIVRGSAVLGSAYLGWPELAEPMRPLATSAEPDESIRHDAALLVGRLDKLAGTPS